MRAKAISVAVALALLAFVYVAPGLRRRFIQDVITWDKPPTTAVTLPAGKGEGLQPTPRVRVVLIDGLSESVAQKLPTWSALCKRGLELRVDVGFPTVSLPVQVSLWTGLTQQQTGVVFRSDRPLVPPLDRRGIPAQVPDSIAIAESHGYIIRSLGFAVAEPHATELAGKDLDPETWKTQWEARAIEAVASESRLAFVHILRVDTWGHRKGLDSTEYRSAAAESDAILARLVAAAPEARWFLLADHGHLPTGGHGGEDRSVRQVEHCIFGPGIAPQRGGLLHLVDISRALADSLTATLDRRSPGRPMGAALSAPLEEDAAIPPIALGTGALTLLVLALGVAAASWSVRRWWLAPWWFVVACMALIIVRGIPTMSMPMVYAKEDLLDFFDFDKRLMMRSWAIALPIAAVSTFLGLGRTSLLRVLAAQLAFPLAAFAAAITACHGWRPLLGVELAPMVPHYTAFASPLFLIASQGAAAVSLAVLARLVLQVFDRRPAAETPNSAT